MTSRSMLQYRLLIDLDSDFMYREKESLEKVFYLMPAIEYNFHLHQQQQAALNLVIDLCSEVRDILQSG